MASTFTYSPASGSTVEPVENIHWEWDDWDTLPLTFDIYVETSLGVELAVSWHVTAGLAISSGFAVDFTLADPMLLDLRRAAGWDKQDGTFTVRVDTTDGGPTSETSSATYTLDPIYEATPTLTYTSDGLGRMLEQFKGSVNLRSLASSYLDQVQTFENAAYPIINARNLDVATGHRLDGLGQLANVPRGGLGDEDYRLRIRAELAVLTSQGSIEDLTTVLQLLIGMPSPPDIQIDEYYPKAIYMRARNFVVDEDPDVIAALLRRAVSAATYFQFIYTSTEADDDDLFRFSDFAGGVAMASIGTYAYRTGVSGADQEIRFNGGAVPANITTCWLGKQDQDSNDRSTEIEALAIDDWIRFVKADDEYVEVQLTGTPTDNTTYYIITVDNGRASSGYVNPPDDTNGTAFLGTSDFSSSHGYSNGTYAGAR